MSLNWNLSKIANHKTTCWREVMDDDLGRGIKKGEYVLTRDCEAIIWLCMALGMPSLTEKTLDEFALRTKLYERLFGAWRRNDVGGQLVDKPFTTAELRVFVGLTTNASSETHAQFLKRMVTRFGREHKS
jgi:hypothetical protein